MARSTVLVTGASSGIGRSFARLFAREGYDVVLVSRRAEPLQAVADEVSRDLGAAARVVTADLSRPGNAEALHAELQRAGASVDVLVNNAGFGLQGAFATLPLERQLEMVQLNVTSLTVLTRLLLPAMLERGRGGVINVASTAGFQPGPLMAVYYATKAYVISFSEALTEEVAGTGVHVTCLAPGPTETGFADEAGMAESVLFRSRRLATPDEVARAGLDAWTQGKALEIVGRRQKLDAMIVRLAPRGVVRRAVRRVNSLVK